jgi:CheY-like chemotaxis protein
VTVRATSTALAVDDEPVLLDLICRLLRRAGFEQVDRAVDGIEALEKMHATRYDVVVLDLRMPRLSGYDVIATLAQEPEAHVPPIVVATADRQATSEGLGAPFIKAVITKPFDIDQFTATLATFLPK